MLYVDELALENAKCSKGDDYMKTYRDIELVGVVKDGKGFVSVCPIYDEDDEDKGDMAFEALLDEDLLLREREFIEMPPDQSVLDAISDELSKMTERFAYMVFGLQRFEDNDCRVQALRNYMFLAVHKALYGNMYGSEPEGEDLLILDRMGDEVGIDFEQHVVARLRLRIIHEAKLEKIKEVFKDARNFDPCSYLGYGLSDDESFDYAVTPG